MADARMVRAQTEVLKAATDMAAYGTGAVFIDNEGGVRHVPVADLSKAPDA